jgi:hypothetical protein
MPRWRIEARFDKAFKSLRANTRFRKAVGIDRDPSRPLSAYERLVGLGGQWEQASLPCEQPKVSLKLDRSRKRRFDLVIRSRCQGVVETTRLDGRWAGKGSDQLQLIFPNQDAADEGLMCRVELCADSSGEDCLRCRPDQDLEFLLRVVRR